MAYQFKNRRRLARAAALCLLALGAVLSQSREARAQWTTSGTNTTTTNNVGIGNGVSNPASKLEVGGQADNLFRVASTGSGATDTVAHFTSAAGNIMIVRGNGNVGVGTASPQAALHVERNIDGDANLFVLNAGGGANSRSIFLLGEAASNAKYAYLAYYGSNHPTRANSTVFANAGAGGFHLFSFGGPNATGGVITFNTAPAAAQGGNDATAERLRIDRDGRVGIGTTAPVTALHVVGDITVTGNVNAKYQDVAEWVPSTQKLAAGTVVVLDTARDNHVVASAKSYDTRVAGVISAQPGITLGEAGEGKALVATTGRVKVRVDATRGAIHVGDLLVTSDTPGVAMLSQPLDLGGVPIHRPGTLIGKALESLDKGEGVILVLLSLQ